MDLHLTITKTEKQLRPVFRRYVYFFYMPWLVRNLVLTLAVLMLIIAPRHQWDLSLTIAIVVLYMAYVPFIEILYWRKIRDTMRQSNSFTLATEFHLTDNSLELRRGGNSSITEYSSFSSFFILGEELFILYENKLFVVFSNQDLPDGFAALTGALTGNGVHRLKFLEWRRWRRYIWMILVFSAIAAGFYFLIIEKTL